MQSKIIMNKYVKNILLVLAQATEEEVVQGIGWYFEARRQAQLIADEFELPLSIVVGVIAALSPSNKWQRNVVDAREMCQVFVGGGYVEECLPSTYKAMRDKAWSILVQGDRSDAAILATLKGPKISDFYSCILGKDVCVIDGHAWCIANGDRRSLQEVPFIGVKLRTQIQKAYSDAGKYDGANLSAYEIQAITWLTWKRIHNV